MKKLLMGFALLLMAATAEAVWHNWQQISADVEQYTGQLICTWECTAHGWGKEHYVVTKGFGFCPRPL